MSRLRTTLIVTRLLRRFIASRKVVVRGNPRPGEFLQTRLGELFPATAGPARSRFEVVWRNKDAPRASPRVWRISNIVISTPLVLRPKLQTTYSTSSGIFTLWQNAA